MDATAFHAMESTARQLEACWAGLSNEDWERSPVATLRAPREVVEHLCDAYRGGVAALNGESYDWGSYSLPEGADPVTIWREERAKATNAILAGDPEKATHIAMEYVALHEAYHVGQLCAVRLALDPDWDAYSIYK